MDSRIIELDLWGGEAEKLPKITVTGQGLKFEGNGPEFDRLYGIPRGWIKS